MSQTEVLLSRLASEQLADLSPTIGRAMVKALTRLTVFPESAPLIPLEEYETYRQVLVKGYRAIYHYIPDDDQVRVYCIVHTRRQLPAPEFLIHQLF
jgi:plasmid stabilization system protein ParE